MIKDELSVKVIAWILLVQVLFVSTAMIIVLFKRCRSTRHLLERIYSTKFMKGHPNFSRIILKAPIVSWFLSLFILALESINGIWSTGTPAIEAWGFKVESTAAACLSFMLLAFHQLAAWQMSSRFLWQYRDIEEIWHLDGTTHKLYIPEALTSLRIVAKRTADLIFEGNPNGANSPGTLRSHNGIYDTEGKSIPGREKHIHDLLRDLDCITNYFFALDKKPGDREKVIEELFLKIMERTVKPLMVMTSGLVDSSEKPIQFPEHFAPIIMNKTLNNAQSSSSSGIIPGATSRFSIQEFRKVYEFSEHPVNKARRVFLLTDEWKKTTTDEIDAIQLNTLMLDSPSPITTLAKKIFGENNPICHFAWLVDYHDSIGWEVKFMDMAEFDRLWDASNLSSLKYKDFLVAPSSVDSLTIVFSADMDHIEDGRKYINLPIDIRRVQVFWDDNGETKEFYNNVWSAAGKPTEFLNKYPLYRTGSQPDAYKMLWSYLDSRMETRPHEGS